MTAIRLKIFLLIITNVSLGVNIALGQDCDNIRISFEIKDATCAGKDDGSITISVNGAAKPLSYSWSNGKKSKNLQNLSAGKYKISIIDGNGCQLNEIIQVFNKEKGFNTKIVIKKYPSDRLSDGELKILPEEATKNSKIIISNYSNPPNISKKEYYGSEINNISSGNYLIDIIDERGCLSSNSIVL